MSGTKQARLRAIHKIITLINPDKIFENGRPVFGKDPNDPTITVSLKTGNASSKYSEAVELLFSFNGVISGLNVTTDNTTHQATITSGTWRFNQRVYYTLAPTQLTISEQDGTLQRYDLIYATNTGTLGIVHGELSEAAVIPDLPEGSVFVASVLITPTSVTHAPAEPLTADDFVSRTTTQTVTGSKTWTATQTYEQSPQIPDAALAHDAVAFQQFGNGINFSGGIFGLGGDLTRNVSIGMGAAHSFEIHGTNGGVDFKIYDDTTEGRFNLSASYIGIQWGTWWNKSNGGDELFYGRFIDAGDSVSGDDEYTGVFVSGFNGGITISDRTALFGMGYAADYSAAGSVSPRWIPDAGWVTGQIGANTTIYTGDGTLSADRTITLGPHALTFDFTNGSSLLAESLVMQKGSFSLQVQRSTDTVGAATATATISLLSGNASMGGYYYPAGAGQSPYFKNIQFTSSGIIITDQEKVTGGGNVYTGAGGRGMMYAADYSANYVTRSLIDKGYAEGRYALASSSVPSTRTLTINGTGFDLSANRSWSVGTVTSLTDSTANGITVSWANRTSAPVPTISLGAIIPTSVNGVSAATISFLDATSSVQTQLNNKLGLGGGTLSGPLILAADPITGLGSATKNYVDNTVNNAIAGLQFIGHAADAASTANVSISSAPASLDGFTGVSGTSRWLLKNQTTASENGMYLFNGTGNPLTRTTDAAIGSQLANKTIPVSQGTLNSDTWWTITNDVITIGSTNIIIVQTAGSGTYAPGTGIGIAGNIISLDLTYADARYQATLGYTAENTTNKATGFGTLNNTLYPTTQAVANYISSFSYVSSVGGTVNRITSSGGATPTIDISSGYVGQASITTLGTIITGTWHGSAIGDTWISSAANWNTAYNERIDTFSVSGSSGAASFSGNILNIPTYTLAGLGGFANPMSTLGDITYGGASGVATRLGGNTTTTKNFLTQTGNGSISAAPTWAALASADITTALGYTPSNSIASQGAFIADPSWYEGFVATRGMIPDGFTGANTQFMSRSTHFSTQAITALKIAIPNWYLPNPGTETGTGTTATVTASVEYPSGTFTQIKFGGSASGSIPNLTTLVSDYATIAIPTGTQFWIRMYIVNAGGLVFQSVQNTSSLGGGFNAGTSGIADLTMTSGSIGSSNTNLSPLGIIGYTNKPSYVILGDSRALGTNDTTSDATGNYGDVTKSMGFNYGYASYTVGGQQLSAWLSSSANQQAMFRYATHIVNAYQSNDIWGSSAISSATAISQATSVQTIARSLNKKIFNVTIGPRTTSSDSWATTGNQTTISSPRETVRVAYNTWIRTGNNGQDGYFDVALANESSLNSGKWAVTGAANFYTSDGVHESSAGETLVVSSGVIAARPYDPTLYSIYRDIAPATTIDGLMLQNTRTAITGNNVYHSPALHFQAYGFASTGGTSQLTEALIDLQSNQGTANPSTNLVINFKVNGSLGNGVYSFGSGGVFGLTSVQIQSTRSSMAATSFESYISQNSTASTAGVPNQWAPSWSQRGTVWNLTATAASNTFAMAIESRGTSATTPTASMFFKGYVGASTTPTYTDIASFSNTGGLSLLIAGGGLNITEGTNGRVGQTTLVAGTKVITIAGLTANSRAFPGFVSQGGTSTTVYQYAMVCTTNTLTITAETVAGVAVTTDTSTINYFIIN